ncbi:MAG TPA: tetratricopeptide repeat protein [Trichocoleus sp.]
MRAPKVTFHALVAIAAWDSLATIAEAYEPSPPTDRLTADTALFDLLNLVAAIKAIPSPETTLRQAFSPLSPSNALPSLPETPSLAELKEQLLAHFALSEGAVENNPVLLWMQNRQRTIQSSSQATEPSSSPLPSTWNDSKTQSESPAQPASKAGSEASEASSDPAPVTSDGSAEVSSESPNADSANAPDAPIPFNAKAAEAASRLALQMAESGQLERARRMAESLSPEQRSQTLAKIGTSRPSAPLTSDPVSSAPSSNAAPTPTPQAAAEPSPPPSTEAPTQATRTALNKAPAATSEASTQARPDPFSTEALGGAETPQPLASARVSPDKDLATEQQDGVPLAVIPHTTTLQEPAAVDLKPLPNRGPTAVVPDLPDSSELLAYARPTPAQSASGMIYPLATEAPITSPFGWRTHPISGTRRFHAGTDFGAAEGTPILAVLPGRVTKARWQGGYGLAIEIEHRDGTVDTFYAHLSKSLVQEGTWVERGTVIGHVGSTGYTTGPHLHFEVRHHTAEGVVEVDPMAELGTASPYAAPAAPAQPTGEPLALLPAKTIAMQTVAPTPSARPIPEYSVANVANLKVATVPASASARTQQAISAPPELPAVTSPTPAPALAQAQMPGLGTSTSAQTAVLPGAAPSTQALAQDRFNNLDIKDYGYWSDLCRSLVAGGQFSDAVAACDRTIALKSDALEPWLYRGQALEGLGQYTEAIANYGYVLHREPKHAESFTYQCRVFLKLGNTDAALEACDQALTSNRFWGQASPSIAWHLRGQVLTQKDQPAEALKAYERALRTEGERSDFLLDRCRALLDLGRYEDVLNACDEALAIDQNWGERSPAQALQVRGQALAKLGKTEDAIATFDQALARDLKDADIWVDQGQLLYDLGRYSDALNSFQQATQLKPNSSQALLGQAATFNELKQYEPALQAVNQALQGDGDWGDLSPGFIWDQRALALGGVGQYEEALAAANRATGLQADYAKAWNNRAVILWNLEQYDEALASTKKAIDLDANYAQAWFNQGRIYSTTKQYQQALNAYDKVLQLNPKTEAANLWINRAAVLWHLDRSDDALAALDKAIQLDPKSTQAFVNKGIMLLELKRFEAAIAAYDKAIELDPQTTAAWYGRGTALTKLNRTEEAKAAFARVNS